MVPIVASELRSLKEQGDEVGAVGNSPRRKMQCQDIKRSAACRSPVVPPWPQAVIASLMENGIMENRILIEIRNDSSKKFLYDGDWLKNGEWKSDKMQAIEAETLSVVEFKSAEVKGVRGIAWFVDHEDKDVYFSMVFANPRLQEPSFACFIGLPPHDLKLGRWRWKTMRLAA
eukprot:symbB.v1.2.005476.t1/scaffold260.1/size426026/27